MKYLTLANIADYLETTLSTAENTALTLILNGIESAVERYCDRTWSTSDAEIVEKVDGGGSFFPLRYGPALTTPTPTITVSGEAVTTVYNYGSYLLTEDPVSSGIQNVTITYSVSSSQLPSDIKLAMIIWAARQFKSHKDAGKDATRVSVGPLSVDYGGQSASAAVIPDFVAKVLDSHRIPVGF